LRCGLRRDVQVTDFNFLTSLFCLQKTADVGGEHSTTDFLECLKEEIGQMARVGGME